MCSSLSLCGSCEKIYGRSTVGRKRRRRRKRSCEARGGAPCRSDIRSRTLPQNPFFETWTTPFGMPPFDRIETAHFMPAFERAISAHRAEIDALRDNPEAPSFANTIEDLERAGMDLLRVSLVFRNLAGTESDDALRQVEREISPILARHRSAIYLDARILARIEAVMNGPEWAGLDAEQKRVTERIHKGFVRAGARLTDAERARLTEITARLATLGTQFAQNVLKDESTF